MKKHLFYIFLSFILLLSLSTAYAKKDSFEVNFKLKELAFAINALNSIELIGEEVTPFIDVRNLLIKEYKKVSSGKKKEVGVEFTMANARNFLFFMQRARFKGVQAVLFNDISTRMVNAIKKNK